MNKQRFYLLLILQSFAFIDLVPQETKVTDALLKHFNDIRARKENKTTSEIKFNNIDENVVINVIKPYFKDSINEVRSEAFYFIKRIGLNSKNSDIRQTSVNVLIEACKDRDGGISGLAGRYLTEFKKSDFNAIALDSLKNLLKVYPHHYETILKLTGYLDLRDMIPFIKSEVSNNTRFSKQVIWAGRLALARMGVDDDVKYCLKMVKSVPVNDDVIYEMVPDLIYTKQKAAFEYLVTILNNKDQNCSSADPESSENIECGYRVMEMLAPVISDYPLELEPSGDIKTDDYPKALQIVREWFKNKNNNYVIITETF